VRIADEIPWLSSSALICSAPVSVLLAGSEKDFSTSSTTAAEAVEEPYKFSADFTIEQAYIGDADVARGGREVNDFDEYYSNVVFVYTPRIKFGILRLGAQWERYSFGFSSSGGQQLPNTLQAVNSIIGLDTKFSDSILVRFEAQPGFYGTSFEHWTAMPSTSLSFSEAPTSTARNYNSSSASV
jgi:hypothetical protein